MWKRKTDVELKVQASRRHLSSYSPKWPFIIALALASFSTLTAWAGWHGRQVGMLAPVPFHTALEGFFHWFTIVFLAVYLVRLVRPLRAAFESPPVICDQCREVQSVTSDGNCPCGGRLESLKSWTWVKDEKKSNG